MAQVYQFRRSGSSPSIQSGGQIAAITPVESGVAASAISLDKSVKINSDPNDIVKTKRIDTEELYPVSSEMRPELVTAFTLLQEGSEHILEAIQAFKKDERMESDSAVIRFQALLPELFCCRTIGDGFGSLIIAIYNGLRNLGGQPLNLKQLETLFQVIRRIKSEPFIQHSEAVDEIIKLDETGFSTDSDFIAPLAELLNDESIR